MITLHSQTRNCT